MGLSSFLFAFLRFLISVSLFYLIFSASFSFVQPLCHDDESFALLKFKESFTINRFASKDSSAYSKVLLWKPETRDCCSWHGVKCNEDTGHVISLDLSSSFLYGSINSTSSLFQLVHLYSLNLAHNHFNFSRIPTGFRRLSRLTNLNLSASVFSGQITPEILELSNLISLDLSWNYELKLQKHGLISIAHKLTNLKELHLSEVDISSTVPNTLANLSSLTSLFLRKCGLHGEFPIGIFHLPNLRSLRLGDNTYLTGRMPEFNKSSPLELLVLSGTSFSGELSGSIGNLKSLDYFGARECNFSGPLPSSLGNLTQLIMLRLEKNMLHGSIPQSISRLVNLEYLDLSSNHLSGTISQSISKLVNLEFLDLSSNNLSGTIPQSISRLLNLECLDLSSNHLNGTIPQSISRLVNLEILSLSSNFLSGTIPKSISRLVNLEILSLSSNHLSGILEFDLFLKLKNLSRLRLSHNNISLLTKPSTNETLPKFEILTLASCDLNGFPDFLRSQDELYILDLSDNKLQGSLPIPPPSIIWYSVSNNTLTGEIPQLICNLSSIVTLDLSSNSLSGLLPQCLGNLSDSLTVLNLHDNNFHGTIPKTFAEGNKLKMIDFSQNQLQGRITRSLANCTMLEALNLGNNEMNDTFPYWLGVLPELRVLILRYNGIYGAMGNLNSSFDFTNIRIIDLSHNEITGKLPSQYFQNWKAMRIIDVKGLMYMQDNNSLGYTYSMTFINKGTEIVYERILVFFMAIDLSSNRFEGEIPKVVGHLKGVKLLNFSNNLLTGPIPSCLENLTELESLDLSQNKLVGVIPLQLTQLNFLGSFNVSHNHLKGPIPQGNQFNTFSNSSFSNNSELCGSPLSKKCENSKDPPLTFEGNRNSESFFEFNWKVVAMGYGCGFMVGIVIGKILIKKKHDWFMKTFAIGKPTPRRVNQRGQRNYI